jgi:hypothetical protein
MKGSDFAHVGAWRRRGNVLGVLGPSRGRCFASSTVVCHCALVLRGTLPPTEVERTTIVNVHRPHSTILRSFSIPFVT